MWRTDSLEKTWCWERLKAGGKGDDRGWDGWMASQTQWMWVWASSRSWWWTGKPGVLQSMGLQRVRHNWATELNYIFICQFQSPYLSYPSLSLLVFIHLFTTSVTSLSLCKWDHQRKKISHLNTHLFQDILSLIYLLELQVGLSRRQLNSWVWSSGLRPRAICLGSIYLYLVFEWMNEHQKIDAF